MSQMVSWKWQVYLNLNVNLVPPVFSYVVFSLAITIGQQIRINTKEVSHVLITKCSQSCFTFISPDSGWTL